MLRALLVNLVISVTESPALASIGNLSPLKTNSVVTYKHKRQLSLILILPSHAKKRSPWQKRPRLMTSKQSVCRTFRKSEIRMLATILVQTRLHVTTWPVVERTRSVRCSNMLAIDENLHVLAPVEIVRHHHGAVFFDVDVAPGDFGILIRIRIAIERKIGPGF